DSRKFSNQNLRFVPSHGRPVMPCSIPFIVLLAAICGTAAAVDYVVDATRLERRFDGVGGLSGGGATSRLLPDYDSKHRDAVLDYLVCARAIISNCSVQAELWS